MRTKFVLSLLSLVGVCLASRETFDSRRPRRQARREPARLEERHAYQNDTSFRFLTNKTQRTQMLLHYFRSLVMLRSFQPSW